MVYSHTYVRVCTPTPAHTNTVPFNVLSFSPLSIAAVNDSTPNLGHILMETAIEAQTLTEEINEYIHENIETYRLL